MRIVDIVTVKGSVEPVELWTCDIDINALIQEKPPKKKETRQVPKTKNNKANKQTKQIKTKKKHEL